ncbi:hypothetical protein IAR50_006682 [Cryptococcus sp. DSM 104548]
MPRHAPATPKRTNQTAQDFDPDNFLQSCASLMSKRQSRACASSYVPPAPIPIPVPASEHTPPYSDGEDGDGLKLSASSPGKAKQHPRRFCSDPKHKNALHYIMAESRKNPSYQELQSPSPEAVSPEAAPALQAAPMRASVSASSAPATLHEACMPPPAYPSSYPETNSPQWAVQTFPPPPPPPSAHPLRTRPAASPEWQTTDAEPDYPSHPDRPDCGLTTEDDRPSSSSSGPKSKKEKVNDAVIPRPPNAWIIYRSEILTRFKKGDKIPGYKQARTDLGLAPLPDSDDESPEGKSGKGLPQADVSKVISYLWKHETKQNKAHYERQAALRKEEHALKYPDYKFKPMRKDLKVKMREDAKQEKEREKRRQKEEKQAEKRRARRYRENRGRSRHSPMSPYDTSRRFTPGTNNTQDGGPGPSTSASRYLQYGEPYLGNHDEATTSVSAPSSSYFGSSVESNGFMMPRHDEYTRPFPLPGYAMPALPFAEGAEPPLAPAPGLAITQDYLWQHAPNHPAPASGSAPGSAPELLAPAMEPQSSSESIPQPPSPPTQPRNEEEDAFQHALVSINVEGMDAYQRPMGVLEMDDIAVLDDAFFGEGEDINVLAEKWHELGSEEFGEEGEEGRGSGLVVDEKNLIHMPEVYYEMSLPQHNAFYPQLPELSCAFTDPAKDLSLPFSPGTQAYGLVPHIHPGDSAIHFGSLYSQHPEYYHSDEYPAGPTLAGEMPLSPSASDTLSRTTPRESSFAGEGYDTNRLPSFSHTVCAVSTSSPAPRLASLSDFPLTPNSLEHIGLPFVDRATSYAGAKFMNMNYASMGMGMDTGGIGIGMGDDFAEDWYGEEEKRGEDEMTARDSVYVTRRDSEIAAAAKVGADMPSPPASQH